MAGEEVVVKFGANVEALRAGAREATGHVDSLRESMLGMKAEATQTGRAARFFANDIASLIPVSGEAKAAVQGLFEVMLAGGAIGAAVGGVKLIIEAFKLLNEEESKSKETFKKFIDEQTESVDKLKTSVEKMILTMQGATRAQILAFEQLKPLQDERKQKDQALKVAQDELAAAQAKAADASGEEALGIGIEIGAAEHRIATIRAEIKALDDLINKKKEPVGKLAGADAAQAAQQIAIAESIEDAKRRAAQVTEQSAINLARIQTEQEKGIERDKASFDEALAHEIADAKRRADQAAEDSAINLARIETEQRTLTKAQIKELKLEMHELGQVSKDVGLAIGEMFVAMATDSASATKVIVDALKTVIKAILEMAIKMVMARAATAAAGAAESQSWIPGVGPFLAIGAIAAVEGAVLALLSLIPGASGGYDIPHGVNPIVQAHGGEMILPRDIADPLRAQLGGGMGGGVTVNLNITTFDAQSFHGYLTSGEGARGLERAFRDLRRRGVMP